MSSFTSVLRASLLLLAIANTIGSPGAAVAATETPALTIELGVAPENTPDQICIVTTAAHPDAQVAQKNGAVGPPNASLRLSEITALRPKPDPAASQDASATAAHLWQFEAGADAGTAPEGLEQGKPRDGHAEGAVVPADSAVAKALLRLRDRPYITAAIAALRQSGEKAATCEGEDICAPRFTMPEKLPNSTGDPDKLYLMCSPNIRPTGHAKQQVAVVFVNTHTSVPPPVRAITLDGNVMTLSLQAAITDQDVFVASVLGGHYAPGGTSASVNRRIVLPLSQRCENRDVELPYYDARSEEKLDVTLAERGQRLLQCQTNIVDGYARVTLPNRATIEPRTLELRGPNSGLRFAATWADRVPPYNLRTSLRGVSVLWRRNCLFPADEVCPAAKLSESGYDCEEQQSPDGEMCAYTCDSGTGTVPIRMPETVAFTRRERPGSWRARLTYSGQVTDDYMPPGERTIVLRGPGRKEGLWEQDALWVDRVELLFSNGQTVTQPFAPGLNKSIATPNLSCDQHVVARYVGTVPYVPEYRDVKGGVIRLEEPKERSLPLDGRFSLGLGHETKPAWANKSDYVQSFGEGAVGSLGIAVVGGPWASPLFYEGAYDVIFSRREFFLQDATGARTAKGAALARGLLGAAIGFRIGGVALSLGASGGISTALLQDDTDSLPIHGVLAPMLRTRFTISGGSALALTTRYYFFEQQRVMDSDNHLLESRARSRASIELAWDFSLGDWMAGRFAHGMHQEQSAQ